MRNIAHMTKSITALRDIEERALRAGIAIVDLHKAAGVHRATWNRWKAGKGAASFDQLDAVEDFLRRHGASRRAA